jgi:RNA polymerase sigma-70 factor (ECF subfamily)
MLNKMATTLDFGSQIHRERPFLRQLAMKLTKHVDDAEDLIQETLFKALKNQDKYQPETVAVYHHEEYVY